MELIRLAELVARSAHKGQLDKGGNPYILHPMTVASFVRTADEKAVAWLHDTVEDTTVTLLDLKILGFPTNIVDAVDAVTRRKGEDRQDYLNRVADNPIAIQVKLADLKHNSDLNRIRESRAITQKDLDRVKRYAEEIKFLESVNG